MDAGCAVVAALLKRQRGRKNIEGLTTKHEANLGRRAAAIVARDTIGVLSVLDTSGVKDTADLAGRAKDDCRSRVSDDVGAALDDLAVDRDIAGDFPLVLGLHACQRTAERFGPNGTVVQFAGLVGLEGETKTARRQSSLITKTVDKGCLAQSAAADSCIANEAVIGKRRRRGRLGDGAEVLVLDGQIGTELSNDVSVNLARCL